MEAEQALDRAQAAAREGRLDEATDICEGLLDETPELPAALALQGVLTSMGGNPEKGILDLRRAIELQPGNATWYAHLGAVCRATCRMEEALEVGHEALRLDPTNPQYWVNLALTFEDVDEHDRAVVCLLRAIGMKPDHAEGHLALGQILLARGEFDAGWMEYEWRLQIEANKGRMPAITSPTWNGMRIPNGRLLVVGDQGYGDILQFSRFIPMAAERCQDLVLAATPEMEPLLANLPGVSKYYSRWEDVPGHAAHCQLASLPYLLRIQPDAISTPESYIKADPSRVAHWRKRLNAELPPWVKRIGLAWAGRSVHPNDHRRSLALSHLTSLADAGPASFVSLQKPVPTRDLESLQRFPMMDIADDLTDFGETAAVVENLDLVITVDTSMGHLAGSLGKPTWILVSKAADWRWMLDRDDSPWYPTVRLFRQSKPGAWQEPIERLHSALIRELSF